MSSLVATEIVRGTMAVSTRCFRRRVQPIEMIVAAITAYLLIYLFAMSMSAPAKVAMAIALTIAIGVFSMGVIYFPLAVTPIQADTGSLVAATNKCAGFN
jgi:hypothetical protein